MKADKRAGEHSRYFHHRSMWDGTGWYQEDLAIWDGAWDHFLTPPSFGVPPAWSQRPRVSSGTCLPVPPPASAHMSRGTVSSVVGPISLRTHVPRTSLSLSQPDVDTQLCKQAPVPVLADQKGTFRDVPLRPTQQDLRNHKKGSSTECIQQRVQTVHLRAFSCFSST